MYLVGARLLAGSVQSQHLSSSPVFHRSRHISEGTVNVGSHGDTLGRTSQGPGQERALERAASAVWCHPSPTAGYTAGGRDSYTGHSSTPRGEKREGKKRKKVEVEGKGRRCREKGIDGRGRGRRKGKGVDGRERGRWKGKEGKTMK